MMKILNSFPDSYLTIIMSAKSVAISFSSVLEEVDHCFPFQSRTPIRILLKRNENSKFELQETAFPSLVDSTFRPPCGKNKNTLRRVPVFDVELPTQISLCVPELTNTNLSHTL